MLELGEVTALLIRPGERFLLGKADFLQVHGVVLKRLWTTNRLTQWWSMYQAEGNGAIPWKIREDKPEKYAQNFQREQGWNFKGNGTTFLNLAAEVRDPHFTAVPYVVMPTRMHQNRNIRQVFPPVFFKRKEYILCANLPQQTSKAFTLCHAMKCWHTFLLS